MRTDASVKKKVASKLLMATDYCPKEVRSIQQSKVVRNSGWQRMGEFGLEGLIPDTIAASLDNSSKTASKGSSGIDQQAASMEPDQVFAKKETLWEYHLRKRAEALVKSWRAPSTEDQDNGNQATNNAAGPSLEMSRAGLTLSARHGETEGPAMSLPWRANASPPQGEPILSWSDVAGTYQPGQIVWVPSHKEVSKDSILHGHEDFGIDPADPCGLSYHQAYAHPALVWREVDRDGSKFICLKITSWSDWSDIPGGKWETNPSVARDRRHLYVPLFSTAGPLFPGMPALTFKDGKSMPKREEDIENRSHVNVERVFLIERGELRDFRLGCQRHELYLTEDSMLKLEEYRNSLCRDDLADKITLVKQKLGHKTWLRRTGQTAAQVPTSQPNGPSWQRTSTPRNADEPRDENSPWQSSRV
ncbi:hypothetical protein E6O75_ATG09397 [Venturia nashicola]|uniref:Uncharacterized protein n=1 Tax=Venturia nashicola TaxID=86259 RepID=A0A4Z1P3C3_9PEZI|nr:hypothetical protein E6O75_ATG09397 [Venturia nashicola]